MEGEQLHSVPAPDEAAVVNTPCRGFCYDCDTEVIPRLLDDGNFQCPTCEETGVECPYESYERWEGTWFLAYTDGYTNYLNINENGLATLRRAESESAGMQLTCVPDDDEGFLMRLDGLRQANTRDYIRLDPNTGGLLFRHEGINGEVVMGSGTRQEPEVVAPAPPVPSGNPLRPNGFRVSTLLHRALDQFDWRGLTGGDDEVFRQQLHEIIVAPLQQMVDQQNDVFMHSFGAAPLFNFDHFSQVLGNAQMFGQRERGTGVTEAAANSWLESRKLDATSDIGADWQCPICFDGDPEDLVSICRDEKGGALHVFHRECVAPWLVRRNECPACRRSPVVEPSFDV